MSGKYAAVVERSHPGVSSLLGGHTIHLVSVLGSTGGFWLWWQKVVVEVSVAVDHQWKVFSLSLPSLKDRQKIVSQGLQNH